MSAGELFADGEGEDENECPVPEDGWAEPAPTARSRAGLAGSASGRK